MHSKLSLHTDITEVLQEPKLIMDSTVSTLKITTTILASELHILGDIKYSTLTGHNITVFSTHMWYLVEGAPECRKRKKNKHLPIDQGSQVPSHLRLVIQQSITDCAFWVGVGAHFHFLPWQLQPH